MKDKTVEIIKNNSIIPIATIDSPAKASPLAKALYSGGFNIIEVTLRTDSALESIREIKQNYPDFYVGAGTVKTIAQCEDAIKNGASFIVSPGFSEKIANYCAETDILYLPGCITPTEITKALEHDINIVKYFPSNLYNGINGMKALRGPFPEISFVPTCGINLENLVDYIREPFVLAAGGSWACPKDLIEREEFDRISELCQLTKEKVLGYEVDHFGINSDSDDEARNFCVQMQNLFCLPLKFGNSSDFASPRIEIKKKNGKGHKGHIAIGTNSIYSAISDMRRKGIEVDETSAVYKSNRLIAIYLKNEIFGYAIHLSQR